MIRPFWTRIIRSWNTTFFICLFPIKLLGKISELNTGIEEEYSYPFLVITIEPTIANNNIIDAIISQIA